MWQITCICSQSYIAIHEITIYNASKPSFPQIDSDNTLIVPFDKSIDQWIA